MTEAFSAFGHSFRMLFNSVLTLSASGMVSMAVVFARLEHPDPTLRWSFLAATLCFAAALLVMVFAGARGAYYELSEGESTHSLNQRETNKKKSSVAVVAVFAFLLGVVAFTIFVCRVAIG